MSRSVHFQVPSRLHAWTPVGLVFAALCLACGSDDGGGQDGDGTAGGTTAGDPNATGDGTATDSGQPDGTADDTAGNPDAVTQTITPEGGTVTSADGLLTLTFPAGAVTEPVEISIGVAGPGEEIEGGSVTYELGPDGQQFELPVVATFSVSWESMQQAADSAGLDLVVGPNAALVYPIVVANDGVAEPAGNQALDMASESGVGLLSGELTHFSGLAFVDAAGGLFGVITDFATSQAIGAPPHVGTAEGITQSTIIEIPSLELDPSPAGVVSLSRLELLGTSLWVVDIACAAEGMGVFAERMLVRYDFSGSEVNTALTLTDPFQCTPAACTASEPAPDAAPEITDVPNSACRGDAAFLGGTNFNPATNCIGLAGTVVEATALTDVFLSFVIPPRAAAGQSDVTIDTGAGTAVGPTQIGILDFDAAVFDSITPSSGASGTEFTIAGEHLDQITSLSFDFFEPVILEQTDTELRFVLTGPPGPLALSLATMSDCRAQGGTQLSHIEVTIE